jgi:c-di-GMP-binding flagellar brake protein YcgR
MAEIRVECYSGHRAEERPLRFVIRQREFQVRELDGRWYSPEASFFRVLADDGNYYVLRHDETQDSWTLDGFRAARAESMDQPLVQTIASSEMRCHRRFRVSEQLEIRVSSNGDEAHVEGVATVIGLGGMFVRTNAPLPPGSMLTLAMTCPAVSFEANCSIRHVNEAGMGVEYTALTPENEAKLKDFVIELQTGATGERVE